MNLIITIALTLSSAISTAPVTVDHPVVYRHAGCDVSTGAYIAYLRGSFQ